MKTHKKLFGGIAAGVVLIIAVVVVIAFVNNNLQASSTSGVTSEITSGAVSGTTPGVMGSFTVSFETNGGNSIDSITSKESLSVKDFKDTEKPDYDFAGWYYDENLTTKAEKSDEISKDTVLYAGWTAKEIPAFTVTFQTNGGDYMDSITSKNAYYLKDLADAEKPDFEFTGWYYDKDLIKKAENTDVIREDTILYASWEAKKVSAFTVTFQTNGESDIAPITAEKAVTLAQFEKPEKAGFQFVGWYFDEEMTHECSSFDEITEDTTFYAKWLESNLEDDSVKFLEDCSPDVSFLVTSDETLTEENILSYLTFENTSFDEVTLSVTKEGDNTYRIAAKNGFVEGFIYKLAIVRDGVRFVEVDGQNVVTDGAKIYSFYVFKDNVYDVQFRDGIVMVPQLLVLNGDIQPIEGTEDDRGRCNVTTYIEASGITLKKDDLIAIGDGKELTPQDMFYKIISLTKEKVDGKEYYKVIGKSPEYSEVYLKYEVYFNQPVSMDELEEDIEAIQLDLVKQMEDSSLNDRLIYMTADAIQNTPEVLEAVELLTPEDRNKFYQMSLSDIIESVQEQTPLVDYRIEDYEDARGNEFKKAKLQISASTGNLTFPLGTSFADGKQVQIQVAITFKMSEEVKTVGYQVIQGDDSYEYSGAYTTTSVVFTAEASILLGNDEKVDITEAIAGYIDDSIGAETAYIEDLQEGNLFMGDLSYETIFEKELAALSFNLYGFSFSIPITFEIELGLQAGVFTSFSYTETEYIYSTNGYIQDGKIHNYDEVIDGRVTISNNIHFNFTIKGKMGVRAGFGIGLNVSLLNMNNLYNVGFKFKVGVYCEWTGYASLDVDRGQAEVTGAIYWEIGIYGELEFSWKWLWHEGSHPLVGFTIPLLRMGAWNYAVGFDEDEMDVKISTPEFYASDEQYAKLLTINLKNGDDAVCSLNAYSSDIDDPNNIVFVYKANEKTSRTGNKVTVDMKTGKVTVSNPKERAEFDVVVGYYGSNGINSEYGIYKTLHVSYLPENVEDKEVKVTFYGINNDIIAEETILSATKPTEPLIYNYYYGLENFYFYTLDSQNPWDKPISVVTEDTDYHLNLSERKLQVKIRLKIGQNGDYNNATWQTLETLDVVMGDSIDLTKYMEPPYEGCEYIGMAPPVGENGTYIVDGTCVDLVFVFNDTTNLCKVTYYNMYPIAGTSPVIRYFRVGEVPSGPELPVTSGGRTYYEYHRYDDGAAEKGEVDNSPIKEGETSRTYQSAWYMEYDVLFVDKDGNDFTTVHYNSLEKLEYPELPEDQQFIRISEYEQKKFSGWVRGYSLERNITVYYPAYNETIYSDITLQFDLGEMGSTGELEAVASTLTYNTTYQSGESFLDSLYSDDNWK